MPSPLLDIGISALRAAQVGLRTAGNNIANSTTPGYSRQRVEFQNGNPEGSQGQQVGTGVVVNNVRRLYDQFLSDKVRTLGSSEARFEIESQLGGRLAGLLGDSDLAGAQDELFTALETLNATPDQISSRIGVLTYGQNLANRIQQTGEQLAELRTEANNRLTESTQDANDLLNQIASINDAIIRSNVQGEGTPNDLLDRRDEVLRQLEQEVPVDIELINDETSLKGTARLSLNLVVNNTSTPPIRDDILLVQPGIDTPLQEFGTRTDAVGDAKVVIDALGFDVELRNGTMLGIQQFRDTALTEAVNAIDSYAQAIAGQFNTQSTQGIDLDRNLGGDIFRFNGQNAVQGPTGFGLTIGSAPNEETAYQKEAAAGETYSLDYDTGTTTYTLTRDSDGATFTPSSGTITVTDADTGSINIFTLDVSTLTPPAMDEQVAVVTLGTARDLEFNISDPRKIAAAAAFTSYPASGSLSPTLIASGDPSNLGGSISTPTVLDPATYTGQPPVTVIFTSPTQFNVVDSNNNIINNDLGNPISGSFYTPPGPTTITTEFGTQFDITGVPNTNDRFTVTAAVANNTGTGTISSPKVADPAAYDGQPVWVVFSSPTQFSVVDASNNPVNDDTGTPLTNIPYTSPTTVTTQFGAQFELSGAPAVGDTFIVESSGNGPGDNRNGLALVGLQDSKVLGNNSQDFGQFLGTTISQAGRYGRLSELTRDTQATLGQQAQSDQASFSGVNLDEEAADIIKFQQYYQAAAKIISTSEEVFQSLLNAT